MTRYDDEERGFLARQLVDTRYMSRVATQLSAAYRAPTSG